MDYDFRNKNPPPMYRAPPPPSSSSSALYPKVGQPPPSHHPIMPPGTSSLRHNPSSGLGIRVAIKSECLITPPPQLLPHLGDIPRSTFQFDFDFERKILAEADKDKHNWVRRLGLDNLPSKAPPQSNSSSMGSVSADPVVSKYIASGLNREAVSLAVANYGDNPTKVREFAQGYTLLREMGFSSNTVAEALVTYDNDTDKALAHFLNGSS